MGPLCDPLTCVHDILKVTSDSLLLFPKTDTFNTKISNHFEEYPVELMLCTFISQIEYIHSKLNINNTGGKHLLANEWIKKMCIYTMEYYSTIKKE